MTPKEKALDLQEKYYVFDGEEYAIRMALICVDEIINELIELDKYEHVPQHLIEEWRDVRKELEKL